jgi:cystathionine gamma-lyase/cystathionine beta-lyase
VLLLTAESHEEESTLHDYPIYEISAISESLGYRVEERHLGIEQGPDIVIRNPRSGMGVIVESEVGHNITSQSYEKFEREAKHLAEKKLKAIVVITETPRRVWRKTSQNVRPRENFFVVAGSVFKDVMPAFGLEFTFLRMDDRKRIEGAIKPNTRMLWLETLSNPLLNIVDIEMVVDIARKHRLLTVVDNTFATPYFFRPVEYGVDLVVHSTTKYLNGHSDVVGGAVVTTTDELSQRVQFLLNALGTNAAPFDCWLVLRGIETLPIRMKQHQENALVVANYLKRHPRVKRVLYPGLESHKGHEIAKRQMKGFGGVVSFELIGGIEGVNTFLRMLKIFSLAESLGGITSLAEHPTTMSHASMPKDYREKVGITNELIRLSVGLENVDDLIEDLEQALEGL